MRTLRSPVRFFFCSKSTFLPKVHILHVINEKKSSQKASQAGWVIAGCASLCATRAIIQPAFLGAVCPYKLLDLPKINGGALGTLMPPACSASPIRSLSSVMPPACLAPLIRSLWSKECSYQTWAFIFS